MLIEVRDPSQILSHFLLNDAEVCEKVASGQQHKETGELKATVFVNGVEIPAETLEKTMKNIFSQYETQIREKYEVPDIDRMVDERARKLLNDKAKELMELFHDISYKLESVDECIDWV